MAESSKRGVHRYNRKVLQLQKEAEHLKQLLKQEQLGLATAHDAQLLLAEGILQHKVAFQLLKPLQDKLTQQAAGNNGSASHSWLSEVLHELRTTSQSDWAPLLELAATSNPFLGPALQMEPNVIKAVVMVTDVDVTRQLLGALFNKMTLLTEMLSPARYPEGLISTTAQSWPAAAAGNDAAGSAAGSGQASTIAGVAGLVQLEEPDVQLAATELSSRLLEFSQLMDDALRPFAVLLLKNVHTMASLGNLNLETGEICTPPGNYFLQAARRLRLTSRQVLHLQLMLKQYNRMARAQNRAGQQVVCMSNNSFNLQACLSSSTSMQATSSVGGVCVNSGSGNPATADLGNQGRPAPAQALVGSTSSCEQEQDACPQAAVLEELLTEHVHNTLDMMTVMSLWARCTLSPWQAGQYLVACWPYFPWLPALVEVSTLLVPQDGPAVHINADCCEAASQAAALAAEIGYMDAHTFMQKRQANLELQLHWALQFAEQLLGRDAFAG